MDPQLHQLLITRHTKEEMVAFLKKNPGIFTDLIRLSVSQDPPLNWRATWLLSTCMKKNDPKVQPAITHLIKAIPGKEDGHQRELLKVLLKMDLAEDQEGHLFDTCVRLWEKISKQPSVRHTAFRYIIKVLRKYPEIAQEIKVLTQDHFLATLSPGIRSSIYKMIRQARLDSLPR